ncbi:MAG: PLP-dependent aminotransferase family protein [Opitutales bacterium]|nr:PLP-dependent aminotransferase family protein [Opitutales bacterium]
MASALSSLFSEAGQLANREEPVISRLMKDALETEGLISLAAGFTDNSLLPDREVLAAAEKLASEQPDRNWLQYGTSLGRPGLRQAVIEHLRGFYGETGLNIDPRNCLISNGSQQSLYLTVQLLCNPGDRVLVEAPSYFVFLELLSGLGVEAVSIPTLANGRWDIPALAQLLEQWDSNGQIESLKLLYFMGTYSNPSSRSVPEADKVALAELLRRRERPLPVIEDMAYRELYFDKPWPARSCLSLESWQGMPVLYAGTFTKPLATGLKTGFAVSHNHDWIQALARIKGHQDFGTANFCQALVEILLRDGFYSKYLENTRPVYKAKMDHMSAALEASNIRTQGWSWQRPEGGLLMWLDGPSDADTRIGSSIWQKCLQNKVLYVPGDLCFAGSNPPRNTLRLSFGAIAMDDIPEGIRRLGTALSRSQNSSLYT